MSVLRLTSPVAVVLFDVCYTLFEANTTYDFLAEHFADNPEYLKLRHSLLSRVRAKFGNLEKELRRDFVALLASEIEIKLKQHANSFISRQRKIDPTHKLLNEDK